MTVQKCDYHLRSWLNDQIITIKCTGNEETPATFPRRLLGAESPALGRDREHSAFEIQLRSSCAEGHKPCQHRTCGLGSP
jgi:hypothetical protein